MEAPDFGRRQTPKHFQPNGTMPVYRSDLDQIERAGRGPRIADCPDTLRKLRILNTLLVVTDLMSGVNPLYG